MVNDPRSSPGHEEESTKDHTESAGFAGAFFPQCPNVRVMGGTFTSEVHVQQTIQNPREHFQWIGRGEIDLRREIRLHRSLVMAPRYHGGNTVRRMYTAKIREQSEKSVILYEGENAEEECQKYIAKHANVWHPNIMQIFGVSGLRGKHIVIAQDSLIPHWEYFALHRLSVILQVYLYALWISDRHDVSEYFLDNIINEGSSMSNPHWIRRSTGRLTVDLESSRIYTPPSWYTYERVHLDWNWHDCFEESQVFEVLSIPHFHRIAIKEFSNYRFLPLENQQNVTDIRLGAVLFSPLGTTGIRELVEVAFLPDLAMIEHELWIAVHPLSETMEDGWRRFNLGALAGDGIPLYWEHRDKLVFARWISQANHIFKRLGIFSKYEDYAFIEHLGLKIRIAGPHIKQVSPRYFFLCPLEHFSRAPDSFGLPETPWFWSFDPTGKDRFTEEEATNHGFPAVMVDMYVCLNSWYAGVYDALRKFHSAKGFDPDSQQLAIHLGYPLYQLASEEE